jgi:hypothetical protein
MTGAHCVEMCMTTRLLRVERQLEKNEIEIYDLKIVYNEVQNTI